MILVDDCRPVARQWIRLPPGAENRSQPRAGWPRALPASAPGVLCALVAGAVLLAGCREAPSSFQWSGATMGTRYHITVADPPHGLDGQAIQRQVDAELNRINAQMSTYLGNSEISKFNAFTGGDWFDVSPEFAFVVGQALRCGELSAGALDVTVAPLVARWNFGPERAVFTVPSAGEVEQLKERVDFRRIEVRDEPPALRKQSPDLQLDLSAIAKGYAVDRITDLLRAQGLDSVMVEIGGEIRVSGTSPRRTAWTVAIEKPVARQRAVQHVLPLRDAALATSGDYRNYFEVAGRRYAHLIDPRSGYPVAHQLASVSVIAGDCLTADAWATALMVLGPQQGYDIAEREEIAALFIERGEQGLVEHETSAFQAVRGRAENRSP